MKSVITISDMLRKDDLKRILVLLPHINPVLLALFPQKGAIIEEALNLLETTLVYMVNHWDEIEVKGELTIHST